MTAPPPMFFVWNGSELEPMERFSRLAEQSFTSGHCYKMMVVEEGERQYGVVGGSAAGNAAAGSEAAIRQISEIGPAAFFKLTA